MAKNEELFNAVVRGKRKDVVAIVTAEIGNGTDVAELLMESMVPAMSEIGDRFSRNEAYVPEMLVAARAMQAGLDLLDPLLAAAGHEPRGKVAIATVKGDLHDIGKNLVGMMIKGAGFEVLDLGVDCPVEKFEDAVSKGYKVIMASALLTTTMPYLKNIAAAFADRDDVKVLIGGAPVTQQYADEIGADGYSADANKAVGEVERVLGLV